MILCILPATSQLYSTCPPYPPYLLESICAPLHRIHLSITLPRTIIFVRITSLSCTVAHPTSSEYGPSSCNLFVYSPKARARCKHGDVVWASGTCSSHRVEDPTLVFGFWLLCCFWTTLLKRLNGPSHHVLKYLICTSFPTTQFLSFIPGFRCCTGGPLPQ